MTDGGAERTQSYASVHTCRHFHLRNKQVLEKQLGLILERPLEDCKEGSIRIQEDI